MILADGTRARLARGARAPDALEACRALGAQWTGPTLLRRVSGYNLDALAGADPDWPRVVCGSEGTLAIIAAAEVRLAEIPAHRGLALLAFPDVDAALDAVVDLLATGPSAIELLDAAMLDPANRAPLTAGLTGFGRGAGALLVIEYSGAEEDVRARRGRRRRRARRTGPRRPGRGLGRAACRNRAGPARRGRGRHRPADARRRTACRSSKTRPCRRVRSPRSPVRCGACSPRRACRRSGTATRASGVCTSGR